MKTAPASTSTRNHRHHLPTDAKERKRIPLWSGLVKYFPDALVAVAKLSQVANEQHNPGEPVHWSREKSFDHEDTLLRHLLDSGTVDNDGQLHSTKVAWRALAMLQIEIERSHTKSETMEDHVGDGSIKVGGLHDATTVVIGDSIIRLNEESLRFIESKEYQDAVEAYAARQRADAYANAKPPDAVDEHRQGCGCFGCLRIS